MTLSTPIVPNRAPHHCLLKLWRRASSSLHCFPRPFAISWASWNGEKLRTFGKFVVHLQLNVQSYKRMHIAARVTPAWARPHEPCKLDWWSTGNTRRFKWSAILFHVVRESASVSTKGLPQKVTRKPLMRPTYNLLNLFTLIIFRVP